MAIKSTKLPGLVEVADPGDAGKIQTPAHHHSITALVTGSGAETRTLSAPTFAGQRCSIAFQTDGGGDVVITSDVHINHTGNTVATSNAAGHYLMLEGVRVGAALLWRTTSFEGFTFS